MATFQKAMQWLKEGKKVRRPCWDEDSYWYFGVDNKISWKDGTTAHIHLNQIEAKDFEIYEQEENIVEEILSRETKGLRINNKTRNKLIFSYDDVEGMLNEIAEEKEKTQ